MSRKLALVIGNTEYTDPGLAELSAPGKDAKDLAQILQDKEMAAFDDVKTIINENSSIVIEAIDEFFDQKKPDDMLVLYFSGHGIRDEMGALYLAFKNTVRSRLRSTAIKSDYIREAMDQSRSKRQVLILDCCNSGAFPHGTKAEVGGSMGITTAFQGYGRFVLTASDATQFAWEGDRLIGETENSLFTHYLIEGLRGEADSDGDGNITVDELYDYAYHQISKLTPNQTPTKSASKQEGEIVLRQYMRVEDIKRVELPEELKEELEDPRPYVREVAVQKLEKIIKGKNIAMARSAAEALEKIANDENTTKRVSLVALQTLEAYRQNLQKMEEERQTILQGEHTNGEGQRSIEKEQAEKLALRKAEEERVALEKRRAEEKAEEERRERLKIEEDRRAARQAELDYIAKTRTIAEHQATMDESQPGVQSGSFQQPQVSTFAQTGASIPQLSTPTSMPRVGEQTPAGRGGGSRISGKTVGVAAGCLFIVVLAVVVVAGFAIMKQANETAMRHQRETFEAMPTATPIPSATPTFTPVTPTSTSISIRLSITDGFENNNNEWTVGPKTTELGTYESSIDSEYDVFVVNITDVNKGFSQAILAKDISSQTDYAVGVNLLIANPGICAGVLFRLTSNGYYKFEICKDQTFLVSHYDLNNQEWTSLIDRTSSSAIKKDEWNYLIVAAVGNSFSFSINNEKVGTAKDSSEAEGLSGLIFETTDPGVVLFDDFTLVAQ